ncbi:MAG: flagellar hook-length control protein FliK [Treponema sp.]|nr:flagellar hook-length control protein FliK [Treponema sp.]
MLQANQTVDISLSSKIAVNEKSLSVQSFKKDGIELSSDANTFGKMLDQALSSGQKNDQPEKINSKEETSSRPEKEKLSSGSEQEKNAEKPLSYREESEKVSENREDFSEEKLSKDKKLKFSEKKALHVKGKEENFKKNADDIQKKSFREKNVRVNQKETLQEEVNLSKISGNSDQEVKNPKEKQLDSWNNLLSRLSKEENDQEKISSRDSVEEGMEIASLLQLSGGIEDFSKVENLKEDDLADEIDVSKVKGKKTYLDKEEKISVTDLRTQEDNKVQDGEELKLSKAKIEGSSAEISVDLQKNAVNANVISSNSQAASSDGSNFQAMLSNQIQANAHEIVKTGSIILKDNDVGEIRLVLNPEELGNVKISLHIDDKAISGKIIVESEAAFNAMKESVQSLKEAFVSSGFEAGAFDLSFAGQGNEGREGSFNEGQNDNARNNFNRALAYEGSLDDSADSFDFYEEINENSLRNSVNIVA